MRKIGVFVLCAAALVLSACASSSSAGIKGVTSEEGTLQPPPAVSSQEPQSGGLPVMTAENQEYYDKYMRAWSYASPFGQDFTEEKYFTDFKVYFLFHESAALDGTLAGYEEKYREGNFPADVVEKTIQGHFLWSTEQIRGAMGAKPQDGSENEFREYYDKAANIYYFPGGYGGAGSEGVVTNATKEGDLLVLDCDWYSDVDGEIGLSHTVTIRLKDDGFQYIANKVTFKKEY